MLSGTIRTVGLKEVRTKLALAPARILEQNALMVEAMLEWVKTETASSTPIGPGHFGYHLRESFSTDIKRTGNRTVGVLKSPATGYWREFGTKGRSRKARAALGIKARPLLESFGGQGERAFMTAHKSLSGARRILKAFYGGVSSGWWRL